MCNTQEEQEEQLKIKKTNKNTGRKSKNVSDKK